MAIIKQGILGGFQKSVGNVVGGSWKGINYMRSKPVSVANPRTSGQVAQRTKFSTIQAIAGILLVGLIKPLWDRFAVKMSGYNSFIQQNIAQVSAAGAVTYANLKMSIGTLLGGGVVTAVASAVAGELLVDWDDNSGTDNAQATDKVYIAAYWEEQDKWIVSSGQFVRSDLEANIQFGSAFGDPVTIHVYVSFRRADGTVVSNSDYVLFNG